MAGEGEPGAGHEVADGARHEHFAWPGKAGDAVGDMHGNAADLSPPPFDLAGVESRSQVKLALRTFVDDRFGTPNRTRRTVEGRQDPVAVPADLMPAVDGELSADHLVVHVERCRPPAVAELDDVRRALDDVGEQDGCEHPVE